MKKAYQLTPAGKLELEKELDELKSRRGLIAQKIADARDYGDLSENSEYNLILFLNHFISLLRENS